jgi:hypothetical protein
VINEGIKKVIYVTVLKHYMECFSMHYFFNKKFHKDVEGIGFKINPYDPCIADLVVNGKHHTMLMI